MKKPLFVIVLILFNSFNLFSQTFTVEKVNGIVKSLIGSSENWIEVKSDDKLDSNTILLTEDNSSVILSKDDTKFLLKENSAINISKIKKMSLDELLLALAMEDIISVPKENKEKNGKNTAVYGEEIHLEKINISNNDFGIKRLNGAKQLAENGFNESSIISAKETYRKYPSTKELADYRIYFTNLIYNLGLYDEALEEFNTIKKLKLTEKLQKEVNKKISILNKKLVD